MHFWIDKRSQTCGFGRARVAASLSGGGGVGLGFGHPPRRLGGKSVVTPIHRLQSNDCNRMHNIHNTNNNNSNSNVSSNNNNNNNNNNNSNSNSNNNNNNGSNNRGNRNRNSNTNTQYHEANNHPPAGSMGRHQNSLDNVYLQRSNLPPVNVECHIPIPLPHIYGGPSHAQELEQGSLGIGPITIRPNMSGIGNTSGNVNVAVETGESQLLPSHLKCGMWASLVLASVFVAGAKFYFDHQGTGLEVLIFCAFSATFFLAACTVSICRLPRDLAASPSASVDGQTRGLDGQLHDVGHQNQAHLFSQSPDQDSIINQQSAATAAPPPPYHIAILLPENSKDLQPDETPPPSYDKILI